MRRWAILVVGVITWPAFASGVESGPAAGAAVPELKVYDATGPHVGAEVDYAAERKDKPTVYLFVSAEKWDRPTARFLRRLDETAREEASMVVVAVWLTGEPDTTKAYLPRAQQSLQLKATTLTCYPIAKKSPEPWNINLEAGITAVVSRDSKVLKSFGLRSPTEADVKEVAKLLEKAGVAK